MTISLRQETNADYEAVLKVIEESFSEVVYSDKDEHFLVEKLRNSGAFIPELSIIAESDGIIIGHILLTRIRITNDNESFSSLALAPVSVLPAFQKKGIGGQLIVEAHKIAKSLGHQSIVLLGHESYYPKFGYELASKYNITIPFEAAEENCQVIELVEDALNGVSGAVEYAKEFYK